MRKLVHPAKKEEKIISILELQNEDTDNFTKNTKKIHHKMRREMIERTEVT